MCKITKKNIFELAIKIGTNLANNLYVVIRMHEFFKYVSKLGGLLEFELLISYKF